eukprot:363950-Chlamydomonas_euryale.AAC.9
MEATPHPLACFGRCSGTMLPPLQIGHAARAHAATAPHTAATDDQPAAAPRAASPSPSPTSSVLAPSPQSASGSAAGGASPVTAIHHSNVTNFKRDGQVGTERRKRTRACDA